MNLKELKKLIFYLCSIEKVSGHENKFANILKKMLTNFTNDIKITSNNSVIAKIVNNSTQPTIILTAHLDEIGFVVSEIDSNGFLQLKNHGGINLKLANFQKIIVHGKKKLTGCTFLKKNKSQVETLFADIGLSKTESENFVSLGDAVNFYSEQIDFNNNKICTKNLDDCAGVATILLVLNKLKTQEINSNLTVIFSSQEETTGTGILTSAYEQNAEIAICLDVSFAKFCDCNDNTLGEFGKGPMIGISPVLNLELTEKLKLLAQTNNIPFQLEIMNGLTSTDADRISKIGIGIKTCLCSIPLRYMHSPIEMIDLTDIEHTANLIIALINSTEKLKPERWILSNEINFRKYM